MLQVLVLSFILSHFNLGGDLALVIKNFEVLSNEERLVFRNFLSSFQWRYDRPLGAPIVKLFPIHQVYHTEDYFVSIKDQIIPPSQINEKLLTNKFLKLTLSGDKLLYKHLEVPSISRSQFYLDYVCAKIDTLDPQLRDETMISILKELPRLNEENPSLQEKLKSLAFVPTKSGKLVAPNSLYDPRIDDFHSILDEQESFPVGEYLNTTVLAVLQVLGMQSALTLTVLVDIARALASTSTKNTEGPAVLNKRAKSLLVYIDANISKFLDPKPTKGKRVRR